MSPFALTLMKFGLLVLLYLFVWRSLKTVASGLSDRPRSAPSVPVPPPPAPPARASKRRGGSGVPTNIVIYGKDGRRIGSFKLTGDIEIGRADHCTIRLADTYASQVHARLSPRNGSWSIEDLGSTNGTFLNERRLESPSQVRSGDKVRIGTTVLELRA
jgi:pSer/pThr/pTyr-binding forkhead associated (FHA) protein